MERRGHPAPWVPIAFTLLAVGAVVLADAERHEMVSVASVFSAGHPTWIRYAIHLSTVVVLGLVALARPARLTLVWAIGAVLIVVNVLATARLVMTMQQDPYVAVAGVELDRVKLRYNTGYNGDYAAFVCFDHFSRMERTAEIDGKTLAPPFLPLPVDWSEFTYLVPELTCIEGS